MGAQGGCGSLTLTPPMEGSPKERLVRLRVSTEKFRQMNAWKNTRTGWNRRVGVLASFEAGGEHGQINPHLHLAVFGPDRQDVLDFIQWLTLSWLLLNPGASTEAQWSGEVHGPAGSWNGWLTYVLKGTLIRPEWCGETLCGVLDLFPLGSRQCTSWGCYSLSRKAAKKDSRYARG